jgi:hypothetical protein
MTSSLPDLSARKDGMNGIGHSTGSGKPRVGEEVEVGRRIECWGHRGASGMSRLCFTHGGEG